MKVQHELASHSLCVPQTVCVLRMALLGIKQLSLPLNGNFETVALLVAQIFPHVRVLPYRSPLVHKCAVCCNCSDISSADKQPNDVRWGTRCVKLHGRQATFSPLGS